MQDDDEQSQGRLGLPIDTGRVWLSLKRGWRIIPIATAIGLALGIGGALLVPHSFQSESVLVWEPVAAAGRVERELSTQAGILKLPSIIEATRKELKMKMSARKLADRIEVWFDRQSNLVTVQASGGTAKEAAQLTGTLVKVFLNHQLELARTRASELVKTLQGDLDTAREAARNAQNAFDAFRTRHGVVDPIAEAELALQAVETLKAQQATANAEATALEAQASQLGDLVKKQPRTRVQSASHANAAAASLAQARADLSSAQSRLAPNHPTVLSLQARIRALETEVAAGSAVVNTVVAPDPEFDSMRSVLSSTLAQQVAAAERGKSYEELLRGAEERVARLSAIEAQARDMMTEIERTNSRVQQIETDLVRAREGVRAPAVEFRVLTPATVPEYPERSKRRIVAAALTLLGLFGSLGFLIIRPLRDGRVYTAREAAYWAKLPVIASTAWPLRKQLFFPFVDEVSDDALRAKGTTLILGLGEREAGLARELARGLSPISAVGESDPPGGKAAMVTPPPDAEDAERTRDDGPAEPSAPQLPNSTALALRSTVAPVFFAWRGTLEGPAVRRAVRIADRVIVLVESGGEAITRLATLRTRLGREHGLALIVVGVPDELLGLPDRVGDVEAFWHGAWVDAAA